MEKQEIILTDEEFYDLFKALRAGIDRLPTLLAKRRNVLDRMAELFKNSPDTECEWVITMRVKMEQEASHE